MEAERRFRLASNGDDGSLFVAPPLGGPAAEDRLKPGLQTKTPHRRPPPLASAYRLRCLRHRRLAPPAENCRRYAAIATTRLWARPHLRVQRNRYSLAPTAISGRGAPDGLRAGRAWFEPAGRLAIGEPRSPAERVVASRIPVVGNSPRRRARQDADWSGIPGQPGSRS